jgi:hypothetical protein
MLQSRAPIFQNYMGFPTDNQFHIGSLFICLIALCSVCSFSALIPFIAHLIGGSYLARIPLCTLFIFTFRSILHHLFPVFTFQVFSSICFLQTSYPFKFISLCQEHTSLTLAATLVAGSNNSALACGQGRMYC